MEHQSINWINQTHKTLSPIVPVMLMIKYDSIKYSAFYFIMFICKFISALIITHSFNLNASSSELKANQGTGFLRFFTAHSIISNGVSFSIYLIGCFVIIILQVANIGHFLYYYYRAKQRKSRPRPSLSAVFIVLIHFHIIAGQVEIEYLSFPYYILGFQQSFLITNAPNNTAVIFFAILNSLFIILINVENYILFQSINTPFNQKTFPVKIKFSISKIGLVLFMENVTILEAFELYADNYALKIYKITLFIVIGVCLLLTAVFSLSEYNFKCLMNDFLAFLASFVFTSLVMEVIVYLTGTCIENNFYLIFLYAWKFILAVIIVYIMKLLNRKILKGNSKAILFKVYDYRLERKDIDTFCYILDLLSELTYGSAESQELLSILYHHKKECCNEKCKCQLIQLFTPPDRKSKEAYCKMLVSRIGFLIETCFVQVDYSNDYHVSMLLSEYFFNFKHNSIMAYSIVQTYFYSSLNKVSLEQVIVIYSISQKYITKCTELISFEQMKYADCYSRFRQSKEIYKDMIMFFENFNSITNAKSSFENSLKIMHDLNTGEITKIYSPYLTSVCLNTIIDTISVLSMTYRDLIQKIVQFSSDFMTIEFCFKVYLFFHIMNAGKVPKEIRPPIEKLISQHLIIDSNTNHPKRLMSIDLTTILYKIYESKKSTYNIIVKFSRGFKIVYFSEKLANDLGFVYSSLIGEDLNVIFPKKFREMHQKAMVNFLITQQNYFYSHSSYVFTSQGQSIPCSIHIASIPGIAKNLILIINIHIYPQENRYSFILNDKYEAISLSDTFDTKYALSLKLVNDFDINLLDVFNIQAQSIEKTFKCQLKKLERFKRTIEVSTDLAFSRILHNHHLYNGYGDSDYQLKKFKVFELQKEVKMKEEDLLQSKQDIEQLYSNQQTLQQKTISFTLKRCKSEIVQNLINLINKFNEMEVYDERYKKLNEALYKFKNSMKEDAFYKSSIKETFDFIDAIASSRYMDSCYYHLKIIVKEVFDQPLFLVKMSEVIGTAPKNSVAKKVQVGRSPLSSVSNRIRSNNSHNEVEVTEIDSPTNKQVRAAMFNSTSAFSNEKPKAKFKAESPKLRPSESIKKTQTKALLKPVEAPKQTNPISMTTKNKIKKLLIGLTKVLQTQNSQSIDKSEIEKVMNFKSTILIIGLFICLLLSLGLSLAILLYQRDVLSIYHLIFYNIHYILFQRDKLLNVYCLSLGILYKVSSITTSDNSPPIESDIKPYYTALMEDAQQLDSLYHNFYFIYLDYKDKEGKSYDEMLLKRNYQQIKLTWRPLKYSSDVFTEMQYLSILYNKAIRSNDDLSDLTADASQFLFNAFFQNPSKEVMSDLGRLMFYFGANYLLTYENFFLCFAEEMNKDFLSLNKEAVANFSVILIFVMIVYIVFFAFVFYYLVKHNNIIFKSIVRMFVFSSPGEKYCYKNQYYNYSLFQKINNLKNVTNNFNIDNLSLVLLTEKINKQYPKLSLTPMASFSLNNFESSSHFISKDTNLPIKANQTELSFKKLSPTHKMSQIKPSRLHSGNLTKQNMTNDANTSSNNTTSSQLNSINTNSHGLLTRKSTRKSLIDEMDDKTLTKTFLLDNTVNSGIQVIKYLKLCSCALFFIFVIYFCINAVLSLSMLNEIQFVFDDFYGFANYYSLAYIYFNELRIKLISPYNTIADEIFSKMPETFDKINTETAIFINGRLKSFKHTHKLFQQLNRNTTSGTREDLEWLCNNNTQCMGIILRNENEIISQGINIAVDSIFLQLTNLHRDYLNAKDDLKTVADVSRFLKGNQYDEIEETLSFVLNNVKEVIYYSLFSDEKEMMNRFYSIVYIFSYLSFGYCFLVFILIMFGIIINVQRHIKPIVYGAYKLNRMFYYNYLEDKVDSQ